MREPKSRQSRLYSRPAARVVHGESRAHKQFEQSRMRLICVCAFFVLCFGALGLRMVEVTFMGGGDLPFKRLVTEPQLLIDNEDKVDKVSAGSERVLRREITDRNGMVLATSVATASLVANPTLIRHEREVARQLHQIFPMEAEEALHKKLMNKQSKFLYLRRHLKPAEQEAVNNLGVPGLFFEADMRRVYPYGGLFSHVIGYVGVDSQGLGGIEKHFDARLEDPVLEHTPLMLSVDLRVQAMLANELRHTTKKFSAIGATGVVYDIARQEIVAMHSLPEFDPNALAKASKDALFNRATLGAYEMGSTFKAFTVANALDGEVTTLTDGFDATHPIRIGGFTINDSHPKARWLSTAEIFAYSSNIGTVKMALKQGAEKQREMLSKLGMFDPVALELPERGHPLVPKQWDQISTMTVAFGHGMSVTPLHVVQGVASVINGGTRAHMTLVKDGNKTQDETRVFSKDTSTKMRDLMRLVVAHGTARGADAKGYRVGGKTGTAEKIVGGRYDTKAQISSFIGAFPMDDPKYIVFLMFDEPKGIKETFGFATAGWVAAPAVGRLVQRIGPVLGVAPDFEKNNTAVDALWAAATMREKEAEERRLARARGVHATSY